MKKKVYKHIEPTEAFRALYVDFEGFAKKPPSMIGVACEYDFEQVVLTDSLKPAGEAKGLRASTVEDIGRELVDRCREEDRLIVGYSQAERKQFKAHAGIRLGRLYRDARMIGRRWVNRLHRKEVSEWDLKTLLGFLGYEAPSHLADGLVTKRLRGVLAGLRTNNGEYEELTPVQKAKWTKLLQYNRVDCLGMRDLVIRASAEIAGNSARKQNVKSSKQEAGGSKEEGEVPSDRKQTNVRMSDEGRDLLEKIADTYGLPMSSVIELAIRKYAQEEGFWTPDTGGSR